MLRIYPQTTQNNPTMKKFTQSLFAVALLFAGSTAFAQTAVGGEIMYPAKNIVENAVNSKDHTILVAAVKTAGLVETLNCWSFYGIRSCE